MATELRARTRDGKVISSGVVRRITVGTYDHHKDSRVVVELRPGDVIAFKWMRKRKWFVADINKVMRTVIAWNVAAEKAQKKLERKFGRNEL